MCKQNLLIWLISIIFITSSFLFSSCSQEDPSFSCKDSLGCIDLEADAPLRIGVLQALSGKVEPLGRAQLHGLELALDAKSHVIHGRSVELKIVDTGCTPEGGANAILKIIADPSIVAVFGTTCSGAAATAAKAMSESGLTMISGNNSAPFLTSIAGKSAPNWQPGYFRTANNEENAGKVVARYAYFDLKARRAATLHDNDIYTKGLTEGFKKAFLELGGEIVFETSINKGDKEMRPVLEAVGAASPDVLFFPLFQPEGNRILMQSKNISSFQNVHMISAGALIEETFLRDVGEAAKGMIFVAPKSPPLTNVKRMSVLYEAKYKKPPGVSYYMSGYDAAGLLIQAIEKAAVYDKKGGLHIGRKKLRDTLYATRAYKGVTGNLSCDQFGDCGPSAFNVLRLDDPAKGLEGLEANVVYSNGPE
jgi:branched-chain amino acid transport system substrate-binding protein